MNRDWIQFWNLLEPEHEKAQAFCRKLAGDRDDGDDLYQDALLNALTRFDGLRDETAFRPWLYRIIINGYKDRRRGWWLRRVIPMTAEIEETLVGTNPASRHAARRRLQIAFRAVSPEDRALMTLFAMEGWKTAELARLTGRTENSIKVRLSRARGRMRRTLARYFRSPSPENRPQTTRSEEKLCVVTKPNED